MQHNDLSYSIILTNQCGLDCSHCFLKGSRGVDTTMPLSTVKAVSDKIVGMGANATINWGGGEPLILGSEKWSRIVDYECFSNPLIENSLYSTLMVTLDADWKQILDRFDTFIFSIDSYRLKNERYNLAQATGNLAVLRGKKSVSYTPSIDDTERDVAQYYAMAQDLGADVFHIGFLYDENLLPEDVYLRMLDEVTRRHALYGGPDIGFFSKCQKSGDPYRAVGWRAYDCFSKMYYIYGNEVTSCYILKSLGYDVPRTDIDTFLKSEDMGWLNKEFIGEFFFGQLSGKCKDCEYQSLCMGGCPYFTARSKEKKDVYCNVYKRIFKELLAL